MRGLIAPLERKNGWTLAEEAGHTGPDRIHRLLNRIEWDADEVLDDVREYVVEHLGDPGAVLIVDDTGFLKKGGGSAGVQRQYSGTAGACLVGTGSPANSVTPRATVAVLVPEAAATGVIPPWPMAAASLAR